MDDGVRSLLDRTPAAVGSFDKTEWPLPVSWAFHAGPPDLDRLVTTLNDRADDDIKQSLSAALCLAELIEAAAPDAGDRFITDDRARTYAFRGAKWRAGWVCLVGDAHRDELARRFHDDRYMVFAGGPGEYVDVDLGPRPTGLIYFLQLMVRYGFIYGLVQPGDDHELGHYLEKDMPGVIVAAGSLSPVENLLVLGLMYLGAPAVVPPSFPYDYGRQVTAESPDDIIASAGRFPNLRERRSIEGMVALPDFCDPANRREEVEAARSWGGSDAGWFCVRPAEGPTSPRNENVPENDPSGLPSLQRGGGSGRGGSKSDDVSTVSVEGDPGPDMAVLVEIGDSRCNEVVTDWLERVAGAAPSYISGVRADLTKTPRIDFAAGTDVTPPQVAEAILAVMRHHYPLLQDTRVTLTFDRAAIDRLRPEIDAFKERRRAAIEGLSDESVGEVYSCIDCQAFAHGHVCFLTPDRPSMCSTRPFLSAMASAYFGDITQPWHRREVDGRPHQQIVPLGACLDRDRGEWEGLNRAVRELSGGKVERVFLHDLRDYPHTSCGCFWAIAFYMPDVDGVGVMTRDFKGAAPDGSTWTALANRAGGKQAPGMAGIGKDYLASPAFLRGHGGLASVVWASATAAAALEPLLPADHRLAIDEQCPTIEALEAFRAG